MLVDYCGAPIMSKHSIIIADDHTVFRETLVRYLATVDGVEVLCGVSDGEAAIEAAKKHQPDVMLLDLSMPKVSGIDVVRTIVGLGLKTRFVVLTMHDNPAMRRVALSAGAHSYLTKNASSEELVRTLIQVAEGQFGQADELKAEDQDLSRLLAIVDQQLSKREKEVLTLIGKGYTSKEIADDLEISPGTVDNYRTRIGSKLGVRGRASMVQAALRAGLVATALEHLDE